MSLITYEFNKADNAGEISQFRETLPILQDHYQGKNEVVLYLSGKLNINGVDIDGLIIKEDAIVLVEFKNYSGDIKAQVNGDWFHGTERINGGAKKRDGSLKTVFEQLRINRRALKEGLQRYTKNIAACNNIQALVVFSSINSLQLDEDFKWGANAWVNVCDISHIGEELDTILAKTQKNLAIYISKDEVFEFIRNKNLDERYILMKYSDVNILPADLFHEDQPHNGDDFSPNVLLAKEKAEKEIYQSSLHDAIEMIHVLMKKMDSMSEEKDVIIQQQKADLLEIKAGMLENIRSQPTTDLTLIEPENEYIHNEIKAIEQELIEIENLAIEQTIETTCNSKTKKRFGMKTKILKDFNVDIASMDDDQLDLIEKNLDKSMIVAGCAGSGKSVIAMQKAEQIVEQGGDVILIAFTKSLNRYMSQGKNNLGHKFYYHWQWKKQHMPKADYIIVDEIQDFDEKEIFEFINAARKCFFFFGDTAQSIYNAFDKKTLDIDAISALAGIKISYLYNNYRLPKTVAKITQNYVGVDVSPYSEKVYLSKEIGMPTFINCRTIEEQFDKIMNIIKTKKYTNVGILMPNNESVLTIMKAFCDNCFQCEFKYNVGYNDKSNKDSLNFNSEIPKVMTYHSAKGLQFETVFLPYYKGANSIDDRKALYVAMTRTYRNLFVLFNEELTAPLSEVPEHLYIKQ